ncbi:MULTISPECIES: hypothetical protein [Pseudomonas]|uniref:hypothetical protein n=1 Tax=Pseudomonas TaxID=286 RepID=UPI0015E2B468|nr:MULTISPECIES: hypothetical protein [Pseudomonas]MBA1241974.1 hypothetical protein [Pseudomonas japonica]MBA1288763.1 hypothetical protein [Pseudomonas japonica]
MNNDIYLLIEHGREYGEAYVLGWFENEATAREAALKMEWDAYRAELRHPSGWFNEKPVPPSEADYKRYWVKPLSKFAYAPVEMPAQVH